MTNIDKIYMISISCLESKLLNNNNWYGRFQLAPFQKGEGLTVANALRRTLLAEKTDFFITWVDFYNGEIPYSLLTGMRESIFDILLNLKQVIFTSDKITANHSNFFKKPSYQAPKIFFPNGTYDFKESQAASDFWFSPKSPIYETIGSNPTKKNLQSKTLKITSNHQTNQTVNSMTGLKTDQPNHQNFIKNFPVITSPISSLKKKIISISRLMPSTQSIQNNPSKKRFNHFFPIYKGDKMAISELNQTINLVLPVNKENEINKTLKLQNFQNPRISQPDFKASVFLKRQPVDDQTSMLLNANQKTRGRVSVFRNTSAVMINKSQNMSAFQMLKSSLNNTDLKILNRFCENQILGKTMNSKDEKACLVPLKRFHDSVTPKLVAEKKPSLKNSILKVGHLKTQSRQWPELNELPETYIGYICAKGPAIIYAKNLLLPKGLKCVDPDQYIATLADDGLFYLRFALTTTIKTLSLVNSSNRPITINQTIKFNNLVLKTFPKILYNQEKQSCFSLKNSAYKSKKHRKLKQTKHKPNQNEIFFSKYHSIASPISSLQAKIVYPGKQFWPSLFFKAAPPVTSPYSQPPDDETSRCTYDEKTVSFSTHALKEQRLLLTNDSIKHDYFQNTSMIANIQKTCLLNLMVKHYYYKSGRFDRFLFDLIKPFKPILHSTNYSETIFKKIYENCNWKIFTYFQKIFQHHPFDYIFCIIDKPDYFYEIIDSARTSIGVFKSKNSKVCTSWIFKNLNTKSWFFKPIKDAFLKKFFGLYSRNLSLLKYGNFNNNLLISRLFCFSPPPSYEIQKKPVYYFLQIKPGLLWKFPKCFILKKPLYGPLYAHLKPLDGPLDGHLKPLDGPLIKKLSCLKNTVNLFSFKRSYKLFNLPIFGNHSICLFENRFLNRDSYFLDYDKSKKLYTKAVKNRSFGSILLKWPKIFKSIKTHSIYDYLQKLATSEATIISSLPIIVNNESTISLDDHKLISQFSFQSNHVLFMKKHSYISFLPMIIKVCLTMIYHNNRWVKALQVSSIKRFLKQCISFQCFKNSILYFLRFFDLHYQNSSDFFNKNLIHRPNILSDLLFRSREIYTEKLLTKIKWLRHESFLPISQAKETRNLLLKPRLLFQSMWPENNLFSQAFESSIYSSSQPLLSSRNLRSSNLKNIDSIKSSRRLLFYINEKNQFKHDNFLRQFYFSNYTGNLIKETLPDYIFQHGHIFEPDYDLWFSEKNSMYVPIKNHSHQWWSIAQKTDFLCTLYALKKNVNGLPKSSYMLSYRFIEFSKLNKGFSISKVPSQKASSYELTNPWRLANKYHVLKSPQFSTNLRAKPFISLSQISYKPFDITTNFCKQNLYKLGCFLKHNDSKTNQNQWINPSAYSTKNSKTNQLGFLGPFSRFYRQKNKVEAFNVLTKNNLVIKPNYLNISHIMYILKQTMKFCKNQRINPRFLDNSMRFNQINSRLRLKRAFRSFWKQRKPDLLSETVRFMGPDNFFRWPCKKNNFYKLTTFNVWILGNNFRFKKSCLYEKIMVQALKNQSHQRWKHLNSYNFNASNLSTAVLPKHGRVANLNVQTQNTWKSQTHDWLNQPYMINLYRSKIVFNLRYTYAFKYTIFETFLPFHGFDLNNNNRQIFDIIQYNESFKIYTTLAYTCLNTYKSCLSKRINFSRRSKKKYTYRRNLAFKVSVFSSKNITLWPVAKFVSTCLAKIMNQNYPKWYHRKLKSNLFLMISNTIAKRFFLSINKKSVTIMWAIKHLPFLSFVTASIKNNRNNHSMALFAHLKPFYGPLWVHLNRFNGPLKLFSSYYLPYFGKSVTWKKVAWKGVVWKNKHFLLGNFKSVYAIKYKPVLNLNLMTLSFFPKPIKDHETMASKQSKQAKMYESIYNFYSRFLDNRNYDSINNFELPSVFNSTYKWRIMNNYNFNDAFIGIPGSWYLNFQYFRKKSVALTLNSKFKTVNSLVSLHVPMLQEIFYENIILQNKSETQFLNSLNQSKQTLETQRHWCNQTNSYNSLTWLSLSKKKPSMFPITSKNNNNKNHPKSLDGHLNKLVVDFENTYYKNFLWNSRKITLRVLNNARLPLVANRKYSISDFIVKKKPLTSLFKFSTPFVYDNQENSGLSFYSIRHKVLKNTNFMCYDNYEFFINDPINVNLVKSNLLDSNPNTKLNKTNLPDSSQALSVFLQKGDIDLASTHFNRFQSPDVSLFKSFHKSAKAIDNWQTKQSSVFLAKSFSDLSFKWKPFFSGSLKLSDVLFVDFTSLKQNQNLYRDFLYNQPISSEKLTAFRKQKYTENLKQESSSFNDLARESSKRFKVKSSFINNLWSSLFFCHYLDYAISTKSDLFLQNLINVSRANSKGYDNSSYNYNQRNRSLHQINPNNDRDQKNSQFINQRNTLANLYLKSYHKTIIKILKSQDYKLVNYFQPNYDYHWKKAINLARLRRFKKPKLQTISQKILYNGSNTSKPVFSEFLKKKKHSRLNSHVNTRIPYKNRFRKPLTQSRLMKQSSDGHLKKLYSFQRLKIHEHYFGNLLRRSISQKWLSFYKIPFTTKLSKKSTNQARSVVLKGGQQLYVAFVTKSIRCEKPWNHPNRLPFQTTNIPFIKSWKSLVHTDEADQYFCFCYPLVIQHGHWPWPKSKAIFGQSKPWLNRITISLEPLLKFSDLSKTFIDYQKLNRHLATTYTQLCSSSVKTHKGQWMNGKSWSFLKLVMALLNRKKYTLSRSPVPEHVLNQTNCKIISYFTIKESLNTVYKVNYIVESQEFDDSLTGGFSRNKTSQESSKNLHELAFNSKQNNQLIGAPILRQDSPINRQVEIHQRRSAMNDALTVSNFLNSTYSFVPNQMIWLNRFNEELMNSQINQFETKNENEYIQIDVWTNGSLSPRQALLNAFKKLFELFYNLSKYNSLKPIKI